MLREVCDREGARMSSNMLTHQLRLWHDEDANHFYDHHAQAQYMCDWIMSFPLFHPQTPMFVGRLSLRKDGNLHTLIPERNLNLWDSHTNDVYSYRLSFWVSRHPHARTHACCVCVFIPLRMFICLTKHRRLITIFHWLSLGENRLGRVFCCCINPPNNINNIRSRHTAQCQQPD